LSHSIDWHKARRKGLGGSDIAAILGISKWRTPMDVWVEKMGLVEPSEESYAMMRGRILEDAIAQWYGEFTGFDLHPGEEMPIEGKHPWMLASPDRYVDDDVSRFILEVKSARSADDWGAMGTAKVPVYYATQGAWYMACKNMDRCDYAALFMINDEFRMYTVHRDMSVENRLLEVAGDWWQKHIVKGEQPDMDGSNAASKYLQDKFPKDAIEMRSATIDEEDLMLELDIVQSKLKQLESTKSKLQNEIKACIGESAGLYTGSGKATWKLQKGRASIDTKRLKEEFPEIAKKLTKHSNPKRMFRLDIKHKKR
jgi:putative phage-type endonuclease